jgi:hypothetical protein
MNRNRSKKKGLHFLIFLLVFTFFGIRLGNSLRENLKVESWREDVVEIAEEECTNCGTFIEEQVPVESGYEILEIEDGLIDITEYIDEDEAEVLGWTSIITNLKQRLWNIDCDIAEDMTLESAVALCDTFSGGSLDYVGGTPVDHGGGFLVDSKTRVVMTEINYPLGYFLGQYVHENSRKEISFRSTEYNANGENIDLDYTMRTLSPEDAVEFRDNFEDFINEKSRKPFLVKAM